MPNTVSPLEGAKTPVARYPSSHAPDTLPLSVNHLRFLNAYQAGGFKDAFAAYRAVYPCRAASARVGVCRLLKRANIQAEIAHRMQVANVVTKESLASDLVKYKQWAEEKKDYEAAASIVIDYAKLAGFLIDKRQEVTPPQELAPSELVAELRRRAIPCPN